MFVLLCAGLSAQTHVSVPLENKVYYILEQAQLKGLCAPLSGIKPYTRNVIITAIKEILDTENIKSLNGTEREILEQYLEKFAKPKDGMDWYRGMYHNETAVGKNETPLSLNVGTNLSIEASSGIYPSFDKRYFGTEIWLRIYLNGDIGGNVSWEFSGEGGLMKAPRRELGNYWTYYEGFGDLDKGGYLEKQGYVNEEITVFGEPLTHFPYSYKKRWDASVHPIRSVADFESWPIGISGAYNLLSELSASFFENILFLRLGRLSREWGSTPLGSNLALNQAARPFLGVEAEFRPFSWFGISTMTGVLEFFNTKGEKESGMTSQNAYSITMMQFRYKNYFFLDLGETVVWPKRFELGYMSPITNTIFYKNNVGDFDNLGMTINIKAQYPGIGNIWFSLFWDEAFWVMNWYELDRSMLAGQVGVSFTLPVLSFSSVRMSYTRINPYCYTHNRIITPWYGDNPMEIKYTNNGVSLGYYLPPNSDEILLRFQTAPAKNLMTHLQYQLVRHGADYGSQAVDGSNLNSELDPEGRDGSNPILKRFFLHDGAYQWMHIIKVGGEWDMPDLPVSLFFETGLVFSYFTDIKATANVTGKSHPYSRINTPEYPRSTGFIAAIGFRIFSR